MFNKETLVETVENIFAQIEENYRYSSPAKRQKAERVNTEFERELKLSQQHFKTRFGGLAVYFSERLYLDSVALTIIGNRRTDLLDMSFLEGKQSKGTFFWLSTEDNMKAMVTNGEHVIRGNTASGQVVWTTEVGLVFKVHPKVFHGFEMVDGWRLPDIDWVKSSVENMEFLHYLPVKELSNWQSFVSEEDQQTEIKIKQLAYRAEQDKKLIAEMQKDGYVINDITKQLYTFFKHFDHYYEYSDDHLFCMRYRAKEKLARQLAQEHDPKLLKLLEVKA